MGTWEYLYGDIWEDRENPIVVFGPGTIPMGHITVVCAKLPRPIGLQQRFFLRLSQLIPLGHLRSHPPTIRQCQHAS